MGRKVGYAVVGLGIGKAHVDAAAASENANLIAVCDLVQEKMDKIVAKYPGGLIRLLGTIKYGVKALFAKRRLYKYGPEE